MRNRIVVALGTALLGMLASGAPAAINLQLYLVASDPGTVTEGNGQTFTGGTWQVYAQLTGSTSTTLGLAGLQINVVAAGDTTIYDHSDGDGSLRTTVNLPTGYIGSDAGLLAGFSVSRSAGSHGSGISAYQSDANQSDSDTDADSSLSSIITGVGLSAQYEEGFAFTQPALVASGFYEGTTGLLYADSTAQNDLLLPAVLPAASDNGTPFGDITVDTVNGVAGPAYGYAYPVEGGLIIQQPQNGPEPASLGLLALGALACFRRRKPA